MVHGEYLEDGWHAKVSADAIVIGVDNNTIRAALHGDEGASHQLAAWVFSRGGPDSARIEWET